MGLRSTNYQLKLSQQYKIQHRDIVNNIRVTIYGARLLG